MSTTQNTIRSWLQQAKERDATHMIVVCDTFDWEDYPVFVLKDEDVRREAAKYDGPNMQKIMEVYKLDLDWEAQVNEYRAFHY